MNMIKEQWGGVTDYFSNLWDSVTSIFNDSLGKVQAAWNSISGLVDKLNFWNDEEANKEVSIKDKRHLSNDNQYSKYAEKSRSYSLKLNPH
ncbi:hypothetical protein AYY26_22015 [Photobacterium phosphoreum]|nr:hypothetical protein AYY26_22015 [Photobacterium phosphoreum]